MFMPASANANSHMTLVSLSGPKVHYSTKQIQDLGDGISSFFFLSLKSSVGRSTMMTAKNSTIITFNILTVSLLQLAQPQWISERMYVLYLPNLAQTRFEGI